MNLGIPYRREEDMYPDIKKWLEQYLASKYPNWEIKVYDTSKTTLSQFLIQSRIQNYFPHYTTYDVKVDVTSILKDLQKKRYFIVLVECKLKSISLKDVSQILGYSRVVRPLHAMIISPKGLTSPVAHLFQKLKRYDVLAYEFDHKGRARKYVKIGTWDAKRKEVLPNSWIPP